MVFQNKTGRVIDDLKKLSFDYIPDKLPNREKQIQQLFTLFRRVVEDGVSQNVFLQGNVGTGKTATAKRFCMDYKKWAAEEGSIVDYVIVNCRRRSNNSSAMWKIVSYFDKGFPDRGFSVGEMMEILRKHIKENNTHLFIILDEIDTLIKREGSELVFLLSRFDDESISPKGSLSLFLISQKNILEFMEESALSTFKRSNQVRFTPYDPDEMYDILQYRARMALYPGAIEEDELRLLSDIAGAKGDARLGIELLEKSGLLAEERGENKIAAEHIRTAKADIDPYMTVSRIKDLNEHEKLILLAATQKLRDQSYTTTGEVEKHYHVICETQGHKKLGHTQFWKYLNSLDDKGLLDTKTKSDGKGRTTRVSISDIPAEVLEEKLTQMIGG
ncbi:MAG: AAA family ATPase [Thermoplasmata archaeon]